MPRLYGALGSRGGFKVNGKKGQDYVTRHRFRDRLRPRPRRGRGRRPSSVGTAVSAYQAAGRRGEFCDPLANRFRQHPLDYVEGIEDCHEARPRRRRAPRPRIQGAGYLDRHLLAPRPASRTRRGRPSALRPRIRLRARSRCSCCGRITPAVAQAERINALAKELGRGGLSPSTRGASIPPSGSGRRSLKPRREQDGRRRGPLPNDNRALRLDAGPCSRASTRISRPSSGAAAPCRPQGHVARLVGRLPLGRGLPRQALDPPPLRARGLPGHGDLHQRGRSSGKLCPRVGEGGSACRRAWSSRCVGAFDCPHRRGGRGHRPRHPASRSWARAPAT